MAFGARQRGVGEVVNGRYLIERPLGSGAMGSVYLAHDAMLNEHLAMKYLIAHPSKASAIASFKTEFATLTKLHHPHITRVYDFGQDDDTGGFFFTSEFVEGTDFYHAVEDRTPQQCEQLFAQGLRALQYLHDRGIHHFDIKPQNVLVAQGTAEGAETTTTQIVKVIDFGLAAVGVQHHLVGTPSYIAPEMIQRAGPDHRADLYSFGVLMYFALARHNPFRAATREETFQRHLLLTPPPLRSLCPEIPPYLEAIIHRLLCKQVEARFSSAAQVLETLTAQSGHDYREATAPSGQPRIWECGFVGRDDELVTTRAHIDAAFESRLDRPALLWIAGGAGTGKTRLLREIKFAAQLRGFATHTFDHADITARLHWLAAMDAAQEDPHTPVALFLDDIDAVIREQQAVEIISGLQSLATATHTQLAIGVPARTLIVIASAADAQTAAMIDQTFPLPKEAVHTLALHNLTPDTFPPFAAGLLEHPTLPALFCHALYQHTEGNPLFTTELLKQLEARAAPLAALTTPDGATRLATLLDDLAMPKTIESCLLQELQALSTTEQQLLHTLAVWQQPIAKWHWQHTATVEPTTEQLTHLVQQQWVSYDPLTQHYRFRSRTKQQLLYRHLDPTARAALHDRITELLIHDGDMTLERLYAHRTRGTGADAADCALFTLAQAQLAQTAFRDAIQTLTALQQATAFPEGSPAALELTLWLAHAHRESGHTTRAEELYQTLQSSMADDERSRLRMMRVYEDLGLTAMRKHDLLAAGAAFKLAHALTTDALEDEVHAIRCENYRARVDMESGRHESAIAIFERTAARAASIATDAQLTITNNALAEAYFRHGRHADALAKLQQEIARYTETGQQRMLGRARLLQGRILRAQHDATAAAQTLEATFAHATQWADSETSRAAAEERGMLAIAVQDWASGVLWLERAVALAAAHQDTLQRARVALGLGQCHRALGHAADAEHALFLALALTQCSLEPAPDTIRLRAQAHTLLGALFQTTHDNTRAEYHLDAGQHLMA
ncbi:MAG: protein kinase [Deltaproteobacteria bacterium]|nr:protein kinase [Deltaproteobacteria bacterium]